MQRQLPPELSENERTALLEFYAGGISAGQLSKRLDLQAEPPPSRAAPQQTPSGPEQAATTSFSDEPRGATKEPRRRARKLAWLIPVLAAALAGGLVGASLGSTSPAAGLHRTGYHKTRHRMPRPVRRHAAHAKLAPAPATASPPSSISGPAPTESVTASAPRTTTTARTTPAATTPSTANPTTSTATRTSRIRTRSAPSNTTTATSTTPSPSTTGASSPTTTRNPPTTTSATTQTTG